MVRILYHPYSQCEQPVKSSHLMKIHFFFRKRLPEALRAYCEISNSLEPVQSFQWFAKEKLTWWNLLTLY